MLADLERVVDVVGGRDRLGHELDRGNPASWAAATQHVAALRAPAGRVGQDDVAGLAGVAAPGCVGVRAEEGGDGAGDRDGLAAEEQGAALAEPALGRPLDPLGHHHRLVVGLAAHDPGAVGRTAGPPRGPGGAGYLDRLTTPSAHVAPVVLLVPKSMARFHMSPSVYVRGGALTRAVEAPTSYAVPWAGGAEGAR